MRLGVVRGFLCCLLHSGRVYTRPLGEREREREGGGRLEGRERQGGMVMRGRRGKKAGEKEREREKSRKDQMK